MTGPYSAGTLYLQVVPVFKDSQRKIKAEAKDLGKELSAELDKAGAEAGERAGQHIAEGMEKGAKDGAKRASKAAEREFRPPKVDFDAGAFEKSVRDACKKAEKQLASFEKSPALARIKRQLAFTSDPKIRPEIESGRAISELRNLQRELKMIATSKTARADVKTNAKATYAELIPLMRLFEKIDGKKLDVTIDLDAGKAAAQAGIWQGLFKTLTGGGENAANSFRSFNAVILGVLVALPALVPVIAAVGGGLMALIPILGAVGAGLGVLAIGFSGIGDVVKGFSDVNKNAGKDAQASAKRIRSAARGVEGAERSLANARKSAAQSNADAARGVADAQKQASKQVTDALEAERDAARNAADAKRDARRAEDDLRQARRKAREELEAARKASRDNRAQNAIDQRQGVVDVFNATVDYNTTMQDGSSTNLEKETASIALEQARLNLARAREEGQELAAEKKKIDREGVDGTDTVKNAQDSLTSALERQRDAQRAVGEAAQNVKEARLEGLQAIADAERNQARTAAAGAESVADAQRALTYAQEDYSTAVNETSTSVNNLNDALSKVGPAGERFARFIYGLREEAYGLRDAVQAAMLPGVQEGLETIISTYGPQFESFAARMGGVIGNLFRRAGQGLGEEPWREFFGTYSKLAPRLLDEFGQTTGNWMGVYARLFTIAAPYAERLSKALEKLSKDALDFVTSGEGTKFWQDFLDYAFKVGPLVADFFWDLWGALVAIAKSLAPLGEDFLKLFDAVFDFIQAMDPATLKTITTLIVGLGIAFMVATGAAVLLAGIGTILLSPISAVVFVIAALGAAFYVAYQRSETFRNIVHDYVIPALKLLWQWFEFVWKVTKIVWTGIWAVLKFVLTAIGALFVATFMAMKWAWDNILHPVWNALAAAATWVWEKVLRPVLGFILDNWTRTFKIMKWVWSNILWPVIDLIGRLLWKLAKFIFTPVMKIIKSGWRLMADNIKFVWKTAIKPVFDLFVDKVLPKLKSAFRTTVEAIGKIWKGLQSLIAAPVRFVIDTVLNKGLIKAFNWVARKVGSKEMGEIPLPSFAQKSTAKSPGGQGSQSVRAYKAGGVLPGYTPGRDVHDFYSPTGGRLHLSGGEAIMRPEWTRAMGRNGVDELNEIARREGIEGVRRRMQGIYHYARGGIFRPVAGGSPGGLHFDNAVDVAIPVGSKVASVAPGRVSRSYDIPGYESRRSHGGNGYRSYGRVIEILHAGFRTLYAHLSQRGVEAGQNVDGGQVIGLSGNTGNSSGPHLHFGSPGASPYSFFGGSTSFTGVLKAIVGNSAIGMVPAWATKILDGPLDWVKGKIKGGLDGLADKFGDNQFVDILKSGVLKVAGGVADKVKDLVSGFSTAAGNDAEYSGSGPVAKQVRDVASRYGWESGAQWDALSWLIGKESGWNPNAANPTSSARGLFQKMTSIHGPLEKTAGGQAVWGLNYIASRYGSPSAAKSFHEKNNWYSQGGVVDDLGSSAGAGVPDNGTMMYDSGGYLPPGLTTVLNLTGKPEPVFTADQFDQMGGGGGAAYHYEPHFEGSDLTANDVAGDMLHGFRVLDTRGKYGGPR